MIDFAIAQELWESKAQMVLDTRMPGKIAQRNATTDTANISATVVINVGEPQDPTALPSQPFINVYTSGASIDYQDSTNQTEETITYTVVAGVPDGTRGRKTSWNQARWLARAAADCLNLGGPDAPGDPNGYVISVTPIGQAQQAATLPQYTGSIAQVTLTVLMRSTYDYNPVAALTAVLPEATRKQWIMPLTVTWDPTGVNTPFSVNPGDALTITTSDINLDLTIAGSGGFDDAKIFTAGTVYFGYFGFSIDSGIITCDQSEVDAKFASLDPGDSLTIEYFLLNAASQKKSFFTIQFVKS